MTKDIISLSISVLLLFRHYISHKITFGAPSSGGVLCSACGAFILKTVQAKVINLTWYVKFNETMAINKLQRSRLTFDLSAKFPLIVVPSIYLKIVFSETSGKFNSNFI